MSKEGAVLLTAYEESQLKRWKSAMDNPDMKFFDDGKGGYLNAHEIEDEIKRGTSFGRELLQTILGLPGKVFETGKSG